MNARDRFLKVCNFEQVDHPPRWDCLGFWGATVERWRRAGRSPAGRLAGGAFRDGPASGGTR